MSISISPYSSLEHLRVELSSPGVMEVVLNRPNQLNKMDRSFFDEIGKAFGALDQDDDCKVVILWAEGRLFSAGLDLSSAMSMLNPGGDSGGTSSSPPLNQHLALFKMIPHLQANFMKISKCNKPVIAAVHNKCLGGGVDLISWCDIRLCTSDTEFSIKETQLALVADIGTLQRISKLTSRGFAREMAFTGEGVSAQRAFHFGYENEVYNSKDEMLAAARKLAKTIAANSPLVVQGVKNVLNYADEHSLEDSLNQVTLWNSAFLLSDDFTEAIASFMQKKTPVFRNKL